MISVVIITHNRQQELVRALRSVQSQTVMPAEVIVIDDGSTPAVDQKTILTALGGISCRLLRNDVPRGPSGARNMGIRAAAGEWIAFLDDDDEFDRNKVAALADEIDRHPGIDLIYHPATVYMVNEKIVYDTQPQSLQTDAYATLLKKNVVGGTSMVTARKTSLLHAGEFDESLKAFEDYELWLRMAQRGFRFQLINRSLTRYYHITRRKSVTKSSEAGLSTFEIIENIYRDDYAKMPAEARREHEVWKRDTITHRAILNLNYLETVGLLARTVALFRQPKHLLMLLAALLGPKFLIRLRAHISPSRKRSDARPAAY